MVTSKMLTSVLNFVGLCILLPILAIILIVLYIYRLIVEVVLKIEYQENFAGLLEGEDAVWAIEKPTARSIINVLGLLESKSQTSLDLVDKFCDLLKSRSADPAFDKLFYRREQKYGYYFWLKDKDFRVEERIKWLEHDSSNCDGFYGNIYGKSLRRSIENLCSQPLPLDHSTSWEILVGKKCSRCHARKFRCVDEEKLLFAGRIKRDTIPLLFRVHHSLGDGAALTKLLLDLIADGETPEERCLFAEDEEFKINGKTKTLKNGAQRNTSEEELNSQDDNELMSPLKDALGPRMPYTYLVTVRFAGKFMQNYINARIRCFYSFSYVAVKIAFTNYVTNKFKKLEYAVRKTGWQKLRNVGKIIVIIFNAPVCFFSQALRSMDNSALHGPKLSGNKLISCWLEDDFRNSDQQKLLEKLRDIKNHTGARTKDIFLAALSCSFHKYLLQINEIPPKNLSVVLPAKMGPPVHKPDLRNSFSVGILPLCISETNDKQLSHPMENSQIFERLHDVSRSHDQLKKDVDYLINSWVMKYLCAVLPDKLSRFVLKSHSTMIFSNVQGPRVIRIFGCNLKDIVVWIPNRCSTGISCSVISYGNDLQLSLMADKVVMKDSKCLSEILENTVREIDNLHEVVSRSCFAKKFEDAKPASMEKV